MKLIKFFSEASNERIAIPVKIIGYVTLDKSKLVLSVYLQGGYFKYNAYFDSLEKANASFDEIVSDLESSI